MRRCAWFSSRWFWVLVFLAATGGGFWAWLERDSLQAWHHCHRLAGAAVSDRERHIQRLAELGESAVAPLVNWLTADEEAACANCGFAMGRLGIKWGVGSPQTQALLSRTAAEFPMFSSSGRLHTLAALDALIDHLGDEAPSPWFLVALSRIVADVRPEAEPNLRGPALRLAVYATGPGRLESETWLRTCRALASAGLRDAKAECRADAIRLAIAPNVNQHEKVAVLLASPKADPSAEVRRLAILAVGGPESEAVAPTDDFLRYLHDEDAAVRTVCEQALRSRGLDGRRLQLARMLTDPDPAVRAQVPAQIFRIPNLDPCLWLGKLSTDTSPAVRAAAIRAAHEHRELRFEGRITEMAERDPSPTVRQIAEAYLNLSIKQKMPHD